ncbi:hypothetical protein MMC08_007558, partial [Hypocenomyce scalaris]|nr:hypothetical protein [Hypocenomyce scalaris]
MAHKAVALKEEDAFKPATIKKPRFSTPKRMTLLRHSEAPSTRTNQAGPRSIQKDPGNPFLFTNRAFSRIKLQSWDSCITDCLKSIDLHASNMKAYYYLAQAQLALHHPNEALQSALTAYDLCLKTNSASAPNISSLVLQAKKEKWEVRERERLRRRSGMLRELEDGLVEIGESEVQSIRERVQQEEVSEEEGAEEEAEVRVTTRKKVEE